MLKAICFLSLIIYFDARATSTLDREIFDHFISDVILHIPFFSRQDLKKDPELLLALYRSVEMNAKVYYYRGRFYKMPSWHIPRLADFVFTPRLPWRRQRDDESRAELTYMELFHHYQLLSLGLNVDEHDRLELIQVWLGTIMFHYRPHIIWNSYYLDIEAKQAYRLNATTFFKFSKPLSLNKNDFFNDLSLTSFDKHYIRSVIEREQNIYSGRIYDIDLTSGKTPWLNQWRELSNLIKRHILKSLQKAAKVFYANGQIYTLTGHRIILDHHDHEIIQKYSLDSTRFAFYKAHHARFVPGARNTVFDRFTNENLPLDFIRSEVRRFLLQFISAQSVMMLTDTDLISVALLIFNNLPFDHSIIPQWKDVNLSGMVEKRSWQQRKNCQLKILAQPFSRVNVTHQDQFLKHTDLVSRFKENLQLEVVSKVTKVREELKSITQESLIFWLNKQFGQSDNNFYLNQWYWRERANLLIQSRPSWSNKKFITRDFGIYLLENCK